MTNRGDSYAPKGKPNPVVKPGEFVFAAAGLYHGHIYGMRNGLIKADGRLKTYYDPDPAYRAAFARQFPGVKAAALCLACQRERGNPLPR